MDLKKQHHIKLRNALAAAYREKEKIEVGTRWKTKTMNRIRRVGSLDDNAGFIMNLEQLLWRLSPVACSLILIFSVFLFNIDFVQEYEMAKLFVDDPVEFAFVQSFGI
jgi:hypothetical protein